MEVKCTQCGAKVPVEADQGLATCPYCSSSLMVSLREGYLHYLLKPLVPDRDIPNVLKSHFERLERKSAFTITKHSRVFWPFWQVQEQDKIKTFIAATNPITSLENAGISSGDARPFRQEETGEDWVEPPTAQMEELIVREGIIPSKAWLVHLPFWIVNYEYDSVTYEAWVDAVRGGVFADELPPTFEKAKDRQYALAAIIVFGVFFLIGVLSPTPRIEFVLYVLSIFPLYFGVKSMLKRVMS